MVPRKLKVRVALFSYAGNGMYSSIHPSIATWLSETSLAFDVDPRVESFEYVFYADTPITMTRNLAVVQARKDNVDVLLMVDSDQHPDFHIGMLGAKPFATSSFDFIHERYDKGPHVVGAPYCGGPPAQVVCVFQWASHTNWDEQEPDQDMRLVKYGRKEASQMAGIQSCAALPTGMTMFDMRIFDVIEPKSEADKAKWQGFFYYEFTDKYCSTKAATEDVTATRDMSLMGCMELGYNPVYCNWDAWVGHWKPFCIGKPNPITTAAVMDKFRAAAMSGINPGERMVYVGDEEDEPGNLPQAAVDSTQHFEDLGIPVNSEHDLRVLQELVRKSVHGRNESATVIEIGTWLGRSAIAMSDAGANVTCIDVWGDFGSDADILSSLYRAYGSAKVYETFVRNVGTRLNRTIHPIKGDSLATAAGWSAGLVDMVFVDATHDYQAAKADILAWMPHVRPGGIISGHDYCDGFPGVKQAVTELFPSGVTVEGNVWWTTKLAAEPTNRISAGDVLVNGGVGV